MTGVLFIINIPQKDHEFSLSKNESIFHSEVAMKDILIPNKGLSKSKSDVTLNINSDTESSKFSWKEVKHALQSNRNKLKISKPVRGNDVLGDFHWDTPLETILSDVVNRLDVKNATWCATKYNKFWQVSFAIETGGLCEELLQVLRTFGIGSRHQSSLSVVPCTLYYGTRDQSHEHNDKYESVTKTGPWTRFSSSVRARTNIAQVLHSVRAEAAITFDWCFLLLVAAMVAAIGLVEDSVVVIVASMLISPLMGPITAGTLGTAVRDRKLQLIGVTHELLGLLLCVVIGFVFGFAVCAVDGQYGIMSDWPSAEMMSRCESRSLWVGMLVAIPSGAGVALAVLGDYTASLVGVAISASLLPPAVNAGLLWALSVYRLISPNDMTWRVGQPSELAELGTRSLCLTLLNILCIYLAGVAVYKMKNVRPLERRDITWWSSNKSRLQASKNEHKSTAWEIYSKWSNDPSNSPKTEQEDQGQNDTITLRRPHVLHLKAQSLEDCLRKVQRNESYKQLDSSSDSTITNISESLNSTSSSKNFKDSDRKTDSPGFSYYNLGYDKKDSENKQPTLEPSISFTVDAKRIGIQTM